MKSETYQKEGWFILEEENQVFGKDAEAVDNNINLESEDFCFYHQNKEEAKKNIDSSSKDLTDFIDSLIQDIPAPSDEEVSAGIEKILKITHPEDEQPETAKTNKKKKVTFRVLFVAALLSILSVSCLFVVGSNNDISIENGFVTFAKDAIKIVFFGESKEEYITVDALLTDLELHGYGDILFPQEFVTKSDEYKVSVPEYFSSNVNQVSFEILDNTDRYVFGIYKYSETLEAVSYIDINDAKTLLINDIYMYVFQLDDTNSAVEFTNNEYRYFIKANITYSEMLSFINNIIIRGK